jgi:hypothetical protein
MASFFLLGHSLVTMQESKPPSNPLNPKHPYYLLFCSLAKVSQQKPRKKSAKNLFAEQCDDEIKQERDAMNKKHLVNGWQEARDTAWDNLSADEKRNWESTSRRKHEKNMAEYNRLKDEPWPITPENRQRYATVAFAASGYLSKYFRCIVNLRQFMQDVLEGVEILTGFCGAAIFCGPEPARGGRFSIHR